MRIYLKKFGTTLTSRADGREALAAFRPTLAGLSKKEMLEIDFGDVITFSPSWGDEFLTPLIKQYGNRVVFKNTNNASVRVTIETLEEVTGVIFPALNYK